MAEPTVVQTCREAVRFSRDRCEESLDLVARCVTCGRLAEPEQPAWTALPN